jgi:DNA-binding transcriptional LysR family regulator
MRRAHEGLGAAAAPCETRGMPDLRAVNLNLLVALDALLAEGHVTRAAARIGLSQSALSHNLASLRELFGDPLFVRTAEGMMLIPRAEALRLPVARTLRSIERILATGPTFVPGESVRRFTIATADFVAVRLLTHLIDEVRRQAPGVELDVRALPTGDLAQALRDGTFDLAVVPRAADDQELASEHVDHDPWVCALRPTHPVHEVAWTVEAYAACEHLLISPAGRGTSQVDALLEARGLTRKVRARVFSFLSAPPLVVASDLLLTATHRQLAPFRDLGIVTKPLPFALPPLELHMVWHRQFDQDGASRWLRAGVRAALATERP